MRPRPFAWSLAALSLPQREAPLPWETPRAATKASTPWDKRHDQSAIGSSTHALRTWRSGTVVQS